MTPQMRVRISAQNDTARGFAEVKRDAVAAANAVEASGYRASTAMATLGEASRMASMQQRNLVFQLNDVAVSLASGMNPLMVFAQQGSQIATIYGPEEGGLGRALKETGNLATGMIAKFWPIAAVLGVGSAAIAGMTAEINKASDTQVSFGDVALATWQEFSSLIYTAVQPAISAVVGWIGGIWDAVRPSLVTLGNALIGTFVGAFDASKVAWSAFPRVMGDIAITTANNVIGGVQAMVNGAIGLLNDFKSFADDAMGGILPDGGIDEVKFGGVANPYEGAMDGVAQDVVGAMGNAMGVDYLGKFFESISARAEDNALARLAEDTGKAAEAAKAANDNFGGFLDIVEEGQEVFDATRTPFENMQADLATLDGLLAQGVISWDTYGRAASTAAANAAAATLGSLASLSSGLGQAFEENKAIAVATAVLKGAESIASAFAAGNAVGGPLVGGIYAGIAAVTAAANVAAVAGTTKTSKTISGGGGGAAAAPATPAAATGPQNVMHVTFGGNSWGVDDFRRFAEEYNQFATDGGTKLVVAGD